MLIPTLKAGIVTEVEDLPVGSYYQKLYRSYFVCQIGFILIGI